MSMREWLIQRVKKAGENIESTLTNILLLALAGGSLGILAFSKKALSFFLQILATPTPVWATILLVLLCYLYIHIRFRKGTILGTILGDNIRDNIRDTSHLT